MNEKTKEFNCAEVGLGNKFVVLKVNEVLNVLDGREQKQLRSICDKLEKAKGKKRSYLVVNCDETYAEEVAELIKSNNDSIS